MLTELNPPPTEPVTLAEAKTFLRIDNADDDALIATLIASARDRLEASLNIAMITRSFQLSKDGGGQVCLPRWPVVSVDSLAVEGEVFVDISHNLRSRPATVDVPPGDYSEIEFTAGFGLSPADVPAPLRQAILLLVSRGYEDRGDMPDTMPLMVDALTMPYRVIGL